HGRVAHGGEGDVAGGHVAGRGRVIGGLERDRLRAARVLVRVFVGDRAQGGLVVGDRVGPRQGEHAGKRVVAAGDVGGVREGERVVGGAEVAGDRDLRAGQVGRVGIAR